jgi:hypothetical protein
MSAHAAGVALAQEHPVGGLRVANEGGESMGEQPSPPGEKHFHLDSGVEGFHIAFEYNGGDTTPVEVRVLGPMGAILFSDTEQCEEPGTFVMAFDHGAVLDDNEYVVNAYVGDESYLADSLQLAIGSASIPPSESDQVPAATDSGAQGSDILQPVATATIAEGAAGAVPGGPSQWMLLVAGIGILVLLAVVLWAARSAMRS